MKEKYMKNLWIAVVMGVVCVQGVALSTPSPKKGILRRLRSPQSPEKMQQKEYEAIFSDTHLSYSDLRDLALSETTDFRKRALYAGMALYRKRDTQQDTRLEAIPGAKQVLEIAQDTRGVSALFNKKTNNRMQEFNALLDDIFKPQSTAAPVGAGGPGGGTTEATSGLPPHSPSHPSNGSTVVTHTRRVPVTPAPVEGSGGGSADDGVGVGLGGTAAAGGTEGLVVDPAVKAAELGLPTTITGLRGLETATGGGSKVFTISHPKYGEMQIKTALPGIVVVIPSGLSNGFKCLRTVDSFVWTSEALAYFEQQKAAMPQAGTPKAPAGAGGPGDGNRSRASSRADAPRVEAEALGAPSQDPVPATPPLTEGGGSGGVDTVSALEDGSTATGGGNPSRAASQEVPGAQPQGSLTEGQSGEGSSAGGKLEKPEASIAGNHASSQSQPSGKPTSITSPAKPKDYKSALGFAVPPALLGALWVWLLASKQGRAILRPMGKLFTKKGRASMTAQERNEALEDLIVLLGVNVVGSASGAYAAKKAYDTYRHNKSLKPAA